MIATFKFHDFVTLSKPTRQTNGTHSGFCTRAGHANHLNAWDNVANFIGNRRFKWCWRTKTQTIISRFFDRINHFWVCMTQNHWSPRAYIIDISVVFGIIDFAAISTVHKNWRTTNACKGTDWRVYTAGNMFTRLGE